MKAHRGTVKPFIDAPPAVVAIKQHPASLHLGIIHRSEDDNVPHMLDLAWHFRLRNDPADPDYFWVEPGFPERRARQVATFCRLVAKRNENGLPYAFSDPDRSIDPMTGGFLLGPTKLGLTCASFVLAVFAATGLPLAVLESWPRGRDGDAEWQAFIVECLEKSEATPEHVAAVRGEIGHVRYRPDEVAAASSIAPPAATFEQVGIPAATLRALLALDVVERLNEDAASEEPSI